MKTAFVFVWPLFLMFFSICIEEPLREPDAIVNVQDISTCGGAGGIVIAGGDGKFIPALKGWGDRNYKVTTSNDSAQYYFNQGMGFYFGYHFTESLASFKEASRFDPSCAMTYWGQALSMGPFYNTFTYKMKKEVPEAVAEMNRYAMNVSEKEKALIAAMGKRYSTDMTNADRKVLDRNYASALSELKKTYSDDHDIKALYIDAVMLEHKWDFWLHDGSPRPWTNELVSDCESILKVDQHPAILHYYIHLVEASRRPDVALRAADALKDKNPGIGHMVHMSTHMYQRNGLYAKGVEVNEQANTSNNVVDTQASALKLGKDRSTHFFAVQSFCAMTAGMYKEGLPIFERARTRQVALVPDLAVDTYAQFVYMMPVMARARLGKWDEILALPQPDPSWRYAGVLDEFAKGVAHVRSKNINSAKQCLEHINSVLTDSLLAVRYMPFNSPAQSCRIASSILEGEILFSEGKSSEAFSAFQRAIDEEDKLVYREPQDWVIPARQFLGAYLLKAGKAKNAEIVYQQDLVFNPGNGWSLLGLSQAFKAQKKTKEADAFKAKYQKAFEHADVKVVASVL